MFSYTAMSDGRRKVGTFPKWNITGWTLLDKEVEEKLGEPATQSGN